MRITELFDKPAPYTWERPWFGREVKARFEIDEREFVVIFEKENNSNYWDVEFSDVDNGYEITGKGNSVAVFSTVLTIINRFIDAYAPAGIIFSAFDIEPSRQKLYNTMVRRLAKQYKVEKTHEGDWDSRAVYRIHVDSTA